MSKASRSVVVIGAGLAGLNCARILAEAGVRVRLIEADDGVGGRVRTDFVEGFTLNRGFQVFLDAYPEAAVTLDYDALDLHTFDSGAHIVVGPGKFVSLFDPRRHPDRLAEAATSPVFTLADRVKAMQLWAECRLGPAERLLTSGTEQTTEVELRGFGFSETAIESFFRPFFGGVLLSPSLSVSSRLFRYLYRMFATGRATLPAAGMQAIPDQLARRATAAGATISLSRRVTAIDANRVTLDDGKTVDCDACVIATDADAAAKLTGQPDAFAAGRWNGEWTFYFAAATPPVAGPTLVLNGLPGTGPVNDLAVLSEAVPAYAPPGQSLISATVLGHLDRDDESIEAAIRSQLRGWFGETVGSWRLIKAYRIPRALPDFTPPRSTTPKSVIVRPGVYVSGDFCEQPSIQGALVAGRRAAEAVLRR